MKLSEIEEVGYLLTAYDEEDVYDDGDINYDVFEFHRDNYTQNDLNKCGLTQWDFCDCQALYTADQMQQFMVQNVRHALTLYGAKVCGFHLEQLEKSEIEKIIQDLFTEDTKND